MFRLINIFRELFNVEGRYWGLDLIRVIGLYYVFVGHGQYAVPESLRGYYNYLTFFPITGVSIFFLLSGFLIGSRLIRKVESQSFNRTELWRFWEKRILGIVPSFYAVLIVLFLLGVRSEEFDWTYLVFCQNLISVPPSFFNVSWSLSIQMWFYFLFPLTIYIGALRKWSVRVSLWVPILCFFAFFYGVRIFDFVNPDVFQLAKTRNVVLFRLDYLVIGFAFSYFWYYYKSFFHKYRYVFASLGVIILVGTGMQVHYADENHIAELGQGVHYTFEGFYHRVLSYNLESVVILYFVPLVMNWKVGKRVLWLKRSFVAVSRLSYSIYLIHGNLVLWYLLPLAQENWNWLNQNAIFGYLFYVIVTLVFSLILYITVHRPCMNLRKRL